MYSTMDEAIVSVAKGGMVVVLDDEDRENEADLVMGAQFATPEKVAFFLEHTSGFLCAALTPERTDELVLPPMVLENTAAHATAFTVSVDLRAGTSTGISARDRAATCRALADPDAGAADFARPGHVMPLRARPGGVLERAGHTEAAIDLCRAAGVRLTALLCELVAPDRVDMLRGERAVAFAQAHGLPVVTITQLVRHLRRTTPVAVRSGEAQIPTPKATFTAIAYRSRLDDVEHLALVLGDVTTTGPVLTRVHSECLTGDLLGSLRCDCGQQLHAALSSIVDAGRGVLVYLRGQEGRGIGIGLKLRAYRLQTQRGLDTVDANTALGLPVDDREYGMAAEVLADLGVREVLLMTNNPGKAIGLSGHGVRVVNRVPIPADATAENLGYLATKRDRMGHLLDLRLDVDTPPDRSRSQLDQQPRSLNPCHAPI